MKKKIVIAVILLSIMLSQVLSSCAIIPTGTKSPPKVTTTTPNIMQRLEALETQEGSYLTQISQLNNQVVADKATIDTLKIQITDLQSQIDALKGKTK